ncbi:MAG: hypothetical protein EXR99_11145 [Gemmataceae bacterium]|nr:hypothetical protein [Gemmataceae bacterium]
MAFKPYVAIKVYPDEEVLALIGATCRIFKQPKEKVETVSYRSDGISNPPGNENGSPSSEEYAFLKPPMESGELGAIGHYRILHALGKGGMGIVFRAVDVRLKRVVALKILEPSYANEAPMKQRFLREARAMAAIKSEYVISIYEVNEIEEMPFLVMEFLEGSSLETQLQGGRKLAFFPGDENRERGLHRSGSRPRQGIDSSRHQPVQLVAGKAAWPRQNPRLWPGQK